LSPHMQEMVSKMKQEWEDTPKEVKRCLKKKMLEKLCEKINDCLSKQNVQNVNFSNIDEPRMRPLAEGQGIDVGPYGAMDKGGNRTVKERAKVTFFMKLNIARAYRECLMSKGPVSETGKQVVTCLQGIQLKKRTDYCESIQKPCSANVTTDCQKRGQQIHIAICKCKKEDERAVLDKLNQLIRQSPTGEVSLGDLIKTLGQKQDPREVIKVAKQCYTDNNADPPEALIFAEGIADSQAAQSPDSTSRPTSLQPKIDPNTLANLHDVLSFDAEDESDCLPCQ